MSRQLGEDGMALFLVEDVTGWTQIQIGCTRCRRVWTPTGVSWRTGRTGCPWCNGWTFLASGRPT